MQKFFFPFSWKLFLSVMSLFLVFAGCFLTYQYHREKEYKTELLDSRLQDYNDRLYEKLSAIEGEINNDSLRKELDEYIQGHHIDELPGNCHHSGRKGYLRQ